MPNFLSPEALSLKYLKHETVKNCKKTEKLGLKDWDWKVATEGFKLKLKGCNWRITTEELGLKC